MKKPIIIFLSLNIIFLLINVYLLIRILNHYHYEILPSEASNQSSRGGHIILSDNKSREDDIFPEFLRHGIEADKGVLNTAVEMYNQGWRYEMPKPRSQQAEWGNDDGRTTWYYGFWYNEITGMYSQKTPVIDDSGFYNGDCQNNAGKYRNGGSPPPPNKLEWLLSTDGGILPQE